MPIINFLLNYPWCFCFCLQTLPDTRSQYTYAKSILKDSCSLKEKLWQTSVQFSSVQSLSRVQLFETPWTAACQANLDSILKSKDIILPIEVQIIKAMVFPIVLYGCESWTIKKAECQRIDAFELWCWRKLLRVPWAARRSNQSILKEIRSEYSLEGLMPKLKLQYFAHLMRRADSLEKTLMLGKIEGRRRRGWQRTR